MLTPYYQDELVTIYHGDAMAIAPTLLRWVKKAASKLKKEAAA